MTIENHSFFCFFFSQFESQTSALIGSSKKDAGRPATASGSGAAVISGTFETSS